MGRQRGFRPGLHKTAMLGHARPTPLSKHTGDLVKAIQSVLSSTRVAFHTWCTMQITQFTFQRLFTPNPDIAHLRTVFCSHMNTVNLRETLNAQGAKDPVRQSICQIEA